MEYIKRNYRRKFRQEDLIHFQVSYKETDLDIGIPVVLYSPKTSSQAMDIILGLRKDLEEYILKNPQFAATLEPYEVSGAAPLIAWEMAKGAAAAGVGPMAAVAGAFAEFTAKGLVGEGKTDIIVENGGDIYLRTSTPRRIGIFAGQSPLSNKISLLVRPEQSPLGICTSSGTVGPSLSFGNADAVVVIAPSTALADAVATAVGNLIKKPDDIEGGIEFAAGIPGVLGIIIIAGDRLAAWGQVELAPIE